MSVKYFEIRTPDPTFIGRIGGMTVVDGVAHVSFDDTRDENGHCIADEPTVQTGRSAVLYAQRAIAGGRNYQLVETDEHWAPLDQADKPKRRAAKTPAA